MHSASRVNPSLMQSSEKFDVYKQIFTLLPLKSLHMPVKGKELSPGSAAGWEQVLPGGSTTSIIPNAPHEEVCMLGEDCVVKRAFSKKKLDINTNQNSTLKGINIYSLTLKKSRSVLCDDVVIEDKMLIHMHL